MPLACPALGRTIQCRISSMRPMHASSARLMLSRFWGCTIWSYAASSFLKICRYFMYMLSQSCSSCACMHGARASKFGERGGLSASTASASDAMHAAHLGRKGRVLRVLCLQLVQQPKHGLAPHYVICAACKAGTFLRQAKIKGSRGMHATVADAQPHCCKGRQTII